MVSKFLPTTSKTQNVYSLRMRLFLSFAVLVFMLLLCFLPFFYVFDILDKPKKNIAEALDNYLINYEQSVTHQFDNLAAYGLRLSSQLSDEIDKTLQENNAEFSDLSNNPELIRILEEKACSILGSNLLTSKSSGAFAFFEATINPSLESAKYSRSGVYLKISNLDHVNDIDPTIFLLRGLPEIADKKNLELHNQWEMEFDTSKDRNIYTELYKNNSKIDEKYYFIKPHFIKNTWEKVIILATPLIGKDGQIYGTCGFEISSLLYNLAHRHIHPSINGIFGILSIDNIQSDNSSFFNLFPLFSHGYSFFDNHSNVNVSKEVDTYYNTYKGENYELVGKEIDIKISPMDLEKNAFTWRILALLPQDIEEEFIFQNNIMVIVFLALFVAVAIVFSYVLVNRFCTPIIKTLQRIKEGKETDSPIIEFNDLIEFIKSKEKELQEKQDLESNPSETAEKSGSSSQPNHDKLQADISAYHLFIQQLETLTKSERKVFELYVQKLSPQDVALELNVSINTIRTHNRNIYGKLYVSSYKELMVYIQMMIGTSKS